jgi:hypothetical protein
MLDRVRISSEAGLLFGRLQSLFLECAEAGLLFDRLQSLFLNVLRGNIISQSETHSSLPKCEGYDFSPGRGQADGHLSSGRISDLSAIWTWPRYISSLPRKATC